MTVLEFTAAVLRQPRPVSRSILRDLVAEFRRFPCVAFIKCGMVRVEFFGVPRVRAGVSFVEMGDVATLGEVFEALANRLPTLQGDCLQWQSKEKGKGKGKATWELTEHCVANLSGHRFVRDLGEPLEPDDVLLILSADAGG